jgi:hypothetical protein
MGREMIVNDKWECYKGEVIIVCFEILLQYMPGGQRKMSKSHVRQIRNA